MGWMVPAKGTQPEKIVPHVTNFTKFATSYYRDWSEQREEVVPTEGGMP